MPSENAFLIVVLKAASLPLNQTAKISSLFRMQVAIPEDVVLKEYKTEQDTLSRVWSSILLLVLQHNPIRDACRVSF